MCLFLFLSTIVCLTSHPTYSTDHHNAVLYFIWAIILLYPRTVILHHKGSMFLITWKLENLNRSRLAINNCNIPSYRDPHTIWDTILIFIAYWVQIPFFYSNYFVKKIELLLMKIILYNLASYLPLQTNFKLKTRAPLIKKRIYKYRCYPSNRN